MLVPVHRAVSAVLHVLLVAFVTLSARVQHGVLRVQVGEALAGFVDIDQQDGDQLAFGAAWRVRWGGARQSPILTRASYGSCGRSQPSPSRDPGLTPTDAQPRCPLQDPLGHERGHQPHNQPFGLMKPHSMA